MLYSVLQYDTKYFDTYTIDYVRQIISTEPLLNFQTDLKRGVPDNVSTFVKSGQNKRKKKRLNGDLPYFVVFVTYSN